jgi:PAS domain S-box-containing protein
MIASLHKFFFSLSFRTHLVLIVLLLSLPAIALISYSGYQQRRDSLNDGITDAKMLVHSILTEQYNMTGDAEQLVTTLAQLSDVKEHRVAATNAILYGIIKLSHQYSNIVICDRSGGIWASALPYTGKLSLIDNRSFQDALKTGGFSSGEYGVGRISGRPNLAFGYPIKNAGGKIDGVILASIDFGFLNDLLVESGLPKGSTFTITDHQGVIVYRNLNAGEVIGTKLKEDIFRQMVQGPGEVSFLDIGRTQDEMITSYGKLRLRGEKSPYLYVQAGIPMHETMVKARRAQWINIAVLSPVLLVAILLAALLSKFCFVNRIQRLQHAAQRLAQGELTIRVSESVTDGGIGGGELGELGRSFDEMARKLTAREFALVRSEAELEDLYNNAPCGYHSLDANGVFVRVNDTELNWLGFTREAVIGRMRFADLVSEQGLQRFEQSFVLLKERGWVNDLEYDLIRRDGTIMPVLLNATTVCAPDGSFIMSRSTIYDITERKQVERELSELNRSLSFRVEEETGRRLQHERLLARHARLAAIGEMIGAIAHQWRQPLATLGATIQSLRMAWERGALSASFLEKAEADAQKQLYYMSDTIEDFRNFFSPEKVVENFDIRERLQEVSLLVSAQFANSGVQLEILDEAPGLPLRIKGYQNEFKQSVLNLVSNAFDAIVVKKTQQNLEGRDDGEPGRVVISMFQSSKGVTIEVRDNGCGIAREIADKVYEPYYTSKPQGKGTGIGLYMSKLIIEESMGGTLAFSSLENGTVFTVVLPPSEIGKEETDG